MNLHIGITRHDNIRKENLCFVLHGFQLPQHDYQNDLVWHRIALKYNGVPSTVRLKIFDYVELTRPIQEWYFEIFSAAAKGSMTETQLKKAWAGFWAHGRAFNDGLGTTQGRNDWINKPNGEGEGIGMNKIVCSGATLEIIGGPENVAGEACWKIRTFNSAAMDLSATPRTHPYQFFDATNATRDGRIEPFPQLGMLPIPTPIISRNMGYDFIPCDRVRVLGQDEALPSPYWK
jgi:hypothetical protein